MRFCLVSTQQNWGGGEVLLDSIASELRMLGHQVSWILRSKSEIAERVDSQNDHVLHRIYGRGRNPLDWWRVSSVLKDWKTDVVLLNDSHAVLLAGSAAWRSPGKRPLRLAYKHTVFPLRSQLKYRLLSDKLICVSDAARQTVVAGGLAEKHAEVIYGGCALPKANQSAAIRVRAELQIKEDEKLLVSVGSLLSCKGHKDAIEAVRNVRNSHRFKLVIAGEGEQRGQLEALIGKYHLQDRVKLLGYRADANDLMAAADLVVHPSLAEGLSLVLIQAQMLAIPTVATAVGGTKEVLSVCSDGTGCEPGEHSIRWIARPSDPEHLARQLDAALNRLDNPPIGWRGSLQSAAKQTCERFGIKKNASQLVSLASRMLCANGKGPAVQHGDEPQHVSATLRGAASKLVIPTDLARSDNSSSAAAPVVPKSTVQSLT